MMRRIPGLFAIIAFTAVLWLTGCGESNSLPNDPSGGGEPPAGHTDLQDGAAHMPGKSNPTANCVACHGQDLRGGDSGEPSCYSCHGQEW